MTIGVPAILNDIGLWVGLIFSLLIFSAIFGDHLLARLAQYVLVGVSLGYLAVLALQNVLRPNLLNRLFNPPVRLADWLTLGLCGLLLLAGVLRILDGGGNGATGSNGKLGGGWRSLVQRLAAAPLAILLGVGATVGLIGVVQGTLAPQIGRLTSNGLDWQSPTDQLVAGLLGFILTAAVLLHLSLDPQRHLRGQPVLVARLIGGWMWIGQRALWLAAGVLFARLFAARFSLLAGQMEFWRASLVQGGLWQWLTGG